MYTFATHPDAFRLPRSSAPNVQISPPDPHIDAIFALLAQTQGFQHYGRLEAEDLTRLFRALVELRGDESLQAKALNTLYKNNDRGQSFGTALMGASDETVNKICRLLSDDTLRHARAYVRECSSTQSRLQVPAIDMSP